ncbi:SMI1/KNR4 family protein [Rhizohabitans arisaemae]|uniref:SMI1/KNR4 family protein n=1 Tax=Rhizohabitans arisaemae TaxID=2720610 RepID=UPI0024B265AC|nr:SMI1/KNR4 family protein [Rhizohabitans arisaemae]
MIRSRMARAMRIPLVIGLLAGGAVSSAQVTGSSECSMLITSSSLWTPLRCVDGRGNRDLKAEARILGRALTADQARAAGCAPIFWHGEPEAEPPEPVDADPSPLPPPREPDPAIVARVNGAWDRIERWLGARASATLRTLRKPMTAADIAEWEAWRGTRLPDDLYASLLRHNGADGGSQPTFPLSPASSGFHFPPAHGLLDLWSMAEASAEHCRALVMGGSLREADPERGMWHGSLLAFAVADDGSDLFVDPRTGRVGVKVHAERVRYEGRSSYLTLLEDVATSLERGTALRGRYPTVTAGCELRWATRPPSGYPSGCAGGPRPSPTPDSPPKPTPTPPPTPEPRAADCPDRRPPVVRRPDPAVAARVNAVWRRIERRLAAKYPVTYRTLKGPARPRAIAEVEARIGAALPDDLRASLLRHDGAKYDGFGPPFFGLMPVESLSEDWEYSCGTDTDAAADGWWKGHLVPFAIAINGDTLVVDTATGKAGEFSHEVGPAEKADWPSFLALLKATATALETGRPIGDFRPVSRKGALDWVEAPPGRRD